jgi:hypothetical protein
MHFITKFNVALFQRRIHYPLAIYFLISVSNICYAIKFVKTLSPSKMKIDFLHICMNQWNVINEIFMYVCIMYINM